MEKITRKQAEYKEPMENHTGKFCGLCEFYNSDKSCQVVKGEVDPSAVCERFKRLGFMKGGKKNGKV